MDYRIMTVYIIFLYNTYHHSSFLHPSSPTATGNFVSATIYLCDARLLSVSWRAHGQLNLGKENNRLRQNGEMDLYSRSDDNMRSQILVRSEVRNKEGRELIHQLIKSIKSIFFIPLLKLQKNLRYHSIVITSASKLYLSAITRSVIFLPLNIIRQSPSNPQFR